MGVEAIGVALCDVHGCSVFTTAVGETVGSFDGVDLEECLFEDRIGAVGLYGNGIGFLGRG